MAKEIKKENDSIFSTLFKDTVHFTEDLSAWSIPYVFYLKDMNEKQLTVLKLLNIDILENESKELFVKLNTKEHDSIILLIKSLASPKTDYVTELRKIPLWIRNIFKVKHIPNDSTRNNR